MALNRYRPHLYVLPEDDATHNIAVGFNDVATGAMQVLKPAGGWMPVLERFKDTYISHLRQYPEAHIVMLIDFDEDFANRIQLFRDEIPLDVASRVYVLGAWDEAETMRNLSEMNFSRIGMRLADECGQNVSSLWGNTQAHHNEPERTRLHAACRGFLF